MKSKLKGVMGIGFALVLVASLMLFAIPTAAGPYEDLEPAMPNMWDSFAPQPGLLGNWFFDPTISQVGPLAQAINGDLYAHVARGAGGATQATGSCTITAGVTVVATDLALDIDGTAITLLCTDTTPTDVANSIVAAINADGTARVTASNAGAVITFTAKTPGTAGNITLAPNDVAYTGGTVTTPITLVGGVDGVQQVDTVVITAANDTLFSLGITPAGSSQTVFTYVSDSSGTCLEIATAFVNQINASSLPVSAAVGGTSPNETIVITANATGANTFLTLSGGPGTMVPSTTTAGVDEATAAVNNTITAGVTATDLALDIGGSGSFNLNCSDTTAILVATSIVSGINASGTATVTASNAGGTSATITFVKKVAGAAGNGVLTMADGTYSGGTVPAVTMAGGADATAAASNDIFKSTDNGRTWSVSTVPAYYTGGAVVDMVCSSMSEDVIYLTDGNYVYKSINGGTTFTLVAQADLENQLVGACGTAITLLPITCIDVGYDGAGKPIVIIGTRDVGVVYPVTHPDAGKPIVGSVYYIADETFSATWIDLDLSCYTCCNDTASPAVGCYDVYSVAAAPGFDSVSKVYAVITAPLSSITYTNASAVVEIRAGDQGAQFTYTAVGGVVGSVASPVTLAAPNSTMTFTATAATGVSTINVTEGTISWRLVSGTGVAFCGGTRMVSTLGTICAWTDVHELQWDCMWSFEIEHASRMMFPSYYASEAAIFVGVAAIEDNDGSSPYNPGPPATGYDYWGEGGDVYRATDGATPAARDCIDLNVQGFTTGCTGLNHANICSLDIDENDAMTAGAWNAYQLQSPTRVYYSADGGWTWASSKKDPTGTDRAYVLFGGSIVAGTRGCDCAFSLSCGANLGDFFNQISLISMDIDQVLDMTHAPGYVFDNTIMYVLTQDIDACDSVDINSLLRWNGTYWERVHSSRSYVVASTQDTSAFWTTPLYDWVEVSPDFNSTDCVYMANTGFYMTRSIDAGCSWDPLVYPCFDRPAISAWIVVDEDTVLAAGAGSDAGFVWRTTNHGAQPWSSFMVQNTTKAFAGNGVDFDLSLPRAADSDVLLGDDNGQVFLSQDLGETWAEIYDATTTKFNYLGDYNTYVVFDPGYGTADDPGETMFYAAAGTLIGRCDYDADALASKQDWVYICPGAETCTTCDLYMASGIDAVGDTVLYVADAGGGTTSAGSVTVSGTVEINCYACAYVYSCSGDYTFENEPVITTGTIDFISGELVKIKGWDLVCTTTCVDSECTVTVTGQIDIMGLSSGAVGYIDFTAKAPTTFYCYDCSCDGTATCTSIGAVISAHLVVTAGTGTSAAPTGVWRTLNPMDLMPPTYPAMVEWEFLNLGSPHSLRHPQADAFGVYPDDLWLTAASNMLWALDATDAAAPFGGPYLNYIWMWDDPLAAPVIQMSPADGALLATSETATLEWEALDAATLYEVAVYAECPECLNPEEMKPVDLNGTAAGVTTTTTATCITITGLTPGTKYFWKVRVACGEPKVSKWSDLRSFDTALSATMWCSPDCGAENITLTPNFSWTAVTGATGYEIEVSTTEDFADVLASGTPTINAWDGIPELDYSTTYYWRVRAVKDGVYSGWTYCLFSTLDEPEPTPEPVKPVVIEETEITPTWIWVIIGIGGALTIAVIILIVTTRRVP